MTFHTAVRISLVAGVTCVAFGLSSAADAAAPCKVVNGQTCCPLTVGTSDPGNGGLPPFNPGGWPLYRMQESQTLLAALSTLQQQDPAGYGVFVGALGGSAQGEKDLLASELGLVIEGGAIVQRTNFTDEMASQQGQYEANNALLTDALNALRTASLAGAVDLTPDQVNSVNLQLQGLNQNFLPLQVLAAPQQEKIVVPKFVTLGPAELEKIQKQFPEMIPAAP